MKMKWFVVVGVISLALVACQDREPVVNEGGAAPESVSTSAQDQAANAAVTPENSFAATCRELEASWNDQQQQCDATAAVCSNAGGVWQADTGCVLEMAEADCVATAGMNFEESKCILRTLSPDVAEVK